MTWDDAWAKLNADGSLLERPEQRAFANAVFSSVTDGGSLLAEAGTGVGKSYGYLIPLIYRVAEKERSVVSTETNALLDQLIDKDLPHLKSVFGGFTFASLKGRRNYLCLNRASLDNAVKDKLKHAQIGRGERRDIDAWFGRRLDDEEWEELSGDADYCAQNKCSSDHCWSARARAAAVDADIVVTNHALLQTHADVEGGILGTFKNLVVDEAHTLEAVLISGWSDTLTPWDMNKASKSLWDAVPQVPNRFPRGNLVSCVDEAEVLLDSGMKKVVNFFTEMERAKLGRKPVDDEWKRLSETLSLKYVRGAPDERLVDAMNVYETHVPQSFEMSSEILFDLSKYLLKEVDDATTGKRKIRKGATAAKRIATVLDIASKSMATDDGIVMRYGVPTAVILDGHKAWKGDAQASIRCVPLDVSKRAAESIWSEPRAVVLVSATLTDAENEGFGYTAASLGISNHKELIVGSPFDFKKQQLLYLTPGGGELADVVGSRFNMQELRNLLDAADGRSLVLFTARSEMEWAANSLIDSDFPHKVLVQEKSSHKGDLASEFHNDVHSVLFATKSFMTGVNFPGDSCSLVVLVKFPNPRWDPECRARSDWWSKRRSYRKWYDREGTLVARQAAGRLIRSESDRGVVALLDQRENTHQRLIDSVGSGGYVTRNIEDVKQWLNT